MNYLTVVHHESMLVILAVVNDVKVTGKGVNTRLPIVKKAGPVYSVNNAVARLFYKGAVLDIR